MSYIQSQKNRVAAILLAFFLGSFGIHRFYLGQTGLGILYLLLCWTAIPGILGVIDCIMFIIMGDEGFDRKYNGGF